MKDLTYEYLKKKILDLHKRGYSCNLGQGGEGYDEDSGEVFEAITIVFSKKSEKPRWA